MLEKQVAIDKIEILENGCVQVRTATKIIEDGYEISNSYHRHVVRPGDDYLNEDQRVQAVCNAVHTPEVVKAYKNDQAALLQEQV